MLRQQEDEEYMQFMMMYAKNYDNTETSAASLGNTEHLGKVSKVLPRVLMISPDLHIRLRSFVRPSCDVDRFIQALRKVVPTKDENRQRISVPKCQVWARRIAEVPEVTCDLRYF
jgi:hypothetical protein